MANWLIDRLKKKLAICYFFALSAFFLCLFKFLRRFYTPVCLIFAICIPLLLFSFLDNTLPKWRMLYIMLAMIIIWLSNAVNIAVAALFPLVLLPILGIVPAGEVATKYMKPSIMLYVGSSIVGTAIAKCGLDRRIALFILHSSGPKEHRLLAGLMLCTSFLSMWMSNTATAVMLLPVVGMIVQIVNDGRASKKNIEKELETFKSLNAPRTHLNESERQLKGDLCTGDCLKSSNLREKNLVLSECCLKSPVSRGLISFEVGSSSSASSSFLLLDSTANYLNSSMNCCRFPNDEGDSCFPHLSINSSPTQNGMLRDELKEVIHASSTDVDDSRLEEDNHNRSFRIMLYLALGYSSSIGGIATLTGTATNTVLVGLLLEHYGSAHNPVTFAKWMFWALPLSMVLLFFAWFIIQAVWLGPLCALRNIAPTKTQFVSVIKLLSVTPMQKLFKCLKLCVCRRRNKRATHFITTESRSNANIAISITTCNRNSNEVHRIKKKLTDEDIQCRVHEEIRNKIYEAHRSLGPWSFGEKIVCVVFVFLVVLLCTRSPDFVPGWGDLFPVGYVDDSTVAVGVGVLCFFLPSSNVFMLTNNKSVAATESVSTHNTTVGTGTSGTVASVCDVSLCSFPNDSAAPYLSGCYENEESNEAQKNNIEIKEVSRNFNKSKNNVDIPYVPILSWIDAVNSIDWGVVLILGGGYALSAGIKVSHLDGWAAEQLAHLEVLPIYLIVLCVLIITMSLTEVTSNVTTANIILPILFSAARAIKINPLLLCLGATVSASFAFMLPISSVCNTISYQASNMRTMDMVKTGSLVSLTALFTLLFFLYTWGYIIFDLNETLEWMYH